MLTTGVACLDSKRKVELLEVVRHFDKLTPDNDPHGEHNFDAIDRCRDLFVFQIDRALTVM